MNLLKKAPTTYLLLVFSLCFSLVGCSSATRESYYEEIFDFIQDFQPIQAELVTASTAFAKDYTSSDATKQLQTAFKNTSTYIRKAEKIKAPSELSEVHEKLVESASGSADSIDELVKVIGLGVNDSNLSEFNKIFTSLNSNLTALDKNLNSALQQSTPAG